MHKPDSMISPHKLMPVILAFGLNCLYSLKTLSVQGLLHFRVEWMNQAAGSLFGSAWQVLFSACAGVIALYIAITAFSTWRERRVRPFTVLIAVLALGVLAAVEFLSATPAEVVPGILSQVCFLVLTASLILGLFDPAGWRRAILQNRLTRLTAAALTAVFFAQASGAAAASTNLQRACRQWPFCFSDLHLASAADWLYLVHVTGIGLASLLLAGLLASAWQKYADNTRILAGITLTAALFGGEILIGALRVPHPQPAALMLLHAQTSLAVWASLAFVAGFVLLDPLAAGATVGNTFINRRRTWKDFLALTKPLIAALLLFTTFAGMLLAQKGLPPAGLVCATLIAGALAAGGSGAINQYIDRDLDGQMARTARRPIAAGRLFPAEGLAFGLGLLVLAFYIMARFVNLNAALLSLSGMLYYLLVYSLVLKRRTAWNIVIGGGAGAIPPLVGWSAAAGGLDLFALALFLIIFLWTPVHFWSLALVRQGEYASVSVPMLPVVRGRKHTAQQILVSTLLLVGFTALISLWGPVHLVYRVTAGLSGVGLLFFVLRLGRSVENHHAHLVYRFSNMYLGFLFLALMLDVFIS